MSNWKCGTAPRRDETGRECSNHQRERYGHIDAPERERENDDDLQSTTGDETKTHNIG